MKLNKMETALWMCFSALLINGCTPKRIATHIPIPAERIDCRVLEEGRPTIPSEYKIDWSRVVSVPLAQAEHQAFVSRLREREAIVSGYIVKLEDRVFVCADDDQWLREYEANLTKKER